MWQISHAVAARWCNPHFFQNKQRNYLCLEYWYWRCFRVCARHVNTSRSALNWIRNWRFWKVNAMNVETHTHTQHTRLHSFFLCAISIENGRRTLSSVVSLPLNSDRWSWCTNRLPENAHSFVHQTARRTRNIELRFIHAARLFWIPAAQVYIYLLSLSLSPLEMPVQCLHIHDMHEASACRWNQKSTSQLTINEDETTRANKPTNEINFRSIGVCERESEGERERMNECAVA